MSTPRMKCRQTELAADEEKLIPAAYVNPLLNAESPLRVYRDLRGLALPALAEKIGVNRVTLA